MPTPDHIRSQFEDKTNLKLGERLYLHRDVIFALPDYPGRLVKIDSFVSNRIRFMEFFDRINKVRTAPTVKVYQYGLLGGKYYYYVMNKLQPVSFNEFNSFYKKLCYHLNGNVFQSDFNWRDPNYSPKLKAFFHQTNFLYEKFGYYHKDLHDGNIMKTRDGEYKFIDLEAFV